MSLESEPVAAVCGTECRIYGGLRANGSRPLQRIKQFYNHGQAKMYAQEFDDATKKKLEGK